jgi:LysM domain
VKIRLFVKVGLILLLPAAARAQIGAGPVTPVSPQRVAVPEPRLPTNPTSPTDFQAPVSPRTGPSGASGGGGGGAAPTGYSGGDYMIVDADPTLWGGVRGRRKNIPRYHTVRQGDTLWEICDHYYSDAWAWPQLWAYNDSITNPHWIYPGDRVRLLGAATAPKGEAFRPAQVSSGPSGPITLKQNGFADPEDLEDSGYIIGSKEERIMLSHRDEIYVQSKGNFRPKVGQTYSIYRVRKKLRSKEGKHVGNLVEILGSARVKRTPKGKAATAVIIESINPIERKDRIGPLRRRYRRLPVRPSKKNLVGTVIGALAKRTYYGIDELVFVDRGKNHGVRKGNRFLVLQRGDGYKRLLADEDQDNKQLPREATAEISIIDVRKNVSVGLITRAIKEVKQGDFLKMRRGY